MGWFRSFVARRATRAAAVRRFQAREVNRALAAAHAGPGHVNCRCSLVSPAVTRRLENFSLLYSSGLREAERRADGLTRELEVARSQPLASPNPSLPMYRPL